MIVQSGKNPDGTPTEFYLDQTLVKNLDEIKNVLVKKNGFDYVCIISGLPGVGKSTFGRYPARYLDPEFNEDKIAFTADDFINLTNKVPEYSAVVLDESFAALNTKVGRSPEFLRIINHLQLIRQKHLFIFLTLPNFFDLAKGISIFRSSHLFLVYADENYKRAFGAFDRRRKRELYIKGNKFVDYGCVNPNFRGRFSPHPCEGSIIVNEAEYERRKRVHLLNIDSKLAKGDVKMTKVQMSRDLAIKYLLDSGLNQEEVGKIVRLHKDTIGDIKRSFDQRLFDLKDGEPIGEESAEDGHDLENPEKEVKRSSHFNLLSDKDNESVKKDKDKDKGSDEDSWEDLGDV